MKMLYPTFISVLLLSASANALAFNTIELVDILHTGNKKGDEIISVQSDSKQLAVSNSKQGTVAVYTLDQAHQPVLVKTHDLSLAEGEQLTSVALHPRHSYFLAAIQAASETAQGRVQIHDVESGQRLASFETGIGPDAVVIDPTGRYALLPNEAEAFIFNPDNNSFSSPEGSLTLLKPGIGHPLKAK